MAPNEDRISHSFTALKDKSVYSVNEPKVTNFNYTNRNGDNSSWIDEQQQL